MFKVKKFLGERFDEFNKIMDDYTYCQNNTINLTACTSYPFPEILDVQGMPLCTLPTEGVVGKRFFPAYKCIDDIENYAEQQALTLFGLKCKDYGVSIQPNSGTQANQIVYNAVLDDGDTVLALSPKEGGHISHSKLGSRKILVKYYSLCDDLTVDYSKLEVLINQYLPKMIIVGASSYPKEFDYEKIKKIIGNKDIYLMADICHSVLYIAGHIHKSIFPYVDFATFTMDKTLRGPQSGVVIFKRKFYNEISLSVFPKTQGGPLQNLMFAKALCFCLLNNININEYAQKVIDNATILSKTLQKNGISVVCKEVHNHIILVDLSKEEKTGKDVEEALFQWGIIVNRNQIPNDKKGIMSTSGIRIGVTTITNLGYQINDIQILGKCISEIILYNRTSRASISFLIEKYHKDINISN